MKVTAYVNVIQYTGSNSAAILALTGGDIETVSETGGIWTVTSCGNEHVIHTGDWVRYAAGCIQQTYSDTAFHDQYLAQGLSGVGVASVPALALNASTNVAVQISPAQPDSSYTPEARLVGAIGQLSITNVTVTDQDTVTVTVQAGLAYVSGAQVLVVTR